MRTITAQQYMDGGEDFDEAFIHHPDTGSLCEIFDVGCTHDEHGNVVLYTAAAEPMRVTPNTLIEVR